MNKSKAGAVIGAVVILILGMAMIYFGLSIGAAPVVKMGDVNVSKYNDKDLKSGQIDIKAFDTLDIDIESMKIIVETGDDFDFEYKAYSENVPNVENKGNTLKVSQKDNIFTIVDFRWIEGLNDDEYYKITVPKDTGIISTKLKASSGDISISDIAMDGKIEITSGRIELKNIKGNKLVLEATSGDVKTQNVTGDDLTVGLTSGSVVSEASSFKNTTIKATSGDIAFDALKTDNLKLDMTSGDALINIQGKEQDFDYKLDVTSGDVRIGNTVIDGNYSVNNGAERKIEADITSGKIAISFR